MRGTFLLCTTTITTDGLMMWKAISCGGLMTMTHNHIIGDLITGPL